MGLTINTNETALAAQRNLTQTNERLRHVLQKLSSGSRIVRASDDAAGLAISDSLNAEIRSINQGIRNAQDGISLVQIYEGGTQEIANMLTRIRELAMQASSDTVGTTERGMLANETDQLKEEVNRIATVTKFTGRQLLVGDNIQLDFQVGSGNVHEEDRITFAPGETDLTLEGLGVEDIDVRVKEDAQNSLELVDKALYKVNDIRARVGSSQSRLQSAINAQSVFNENISAARSRIRDADIAKESSALVQETILRKAGAAVLTQANETPRLALQLLRF